MSAFYQVHFFNFCCWMIALFFVAYLSLASSADDLTASDFVHKVVKAQFLPALAGSLCIFETEAKYTLTSMCTPDNGRSASASAVMLSYLWCTKVRPADRLIFFLLQALILSIAATFVTVVVLTPRLLRPCCSLRVLWVANWPAISPVSSPRGPKAR